MGIAGDQVSVERRMGLSKLKCGGPTEGDSDDGADGSRDLESSEDRRDVVGKLRERCRG